VGTDPAVRDAADPRKGDTAVLARGGCYGYAIQTSLALDTLREDGGEPLYVRVNSDAPEHPAGDPLKIWRLSTGEAFAQLYSRSRDHIVWVNDAGWFAVDPRIPSITVTPVAPQPLWETRLWGLPAALCYLQRGDLPLHAAAVDVDGSALVMAAPGKFGKTTLVSAFHEAGHRLLAEDLTCCRTGERAAVIPGPALLRVRPDTYARLVLRGTRVVARKSDRIYLAIDEPRRGNCAPVPLKGIVFLRGSRDLVTMEQVRPQNAIPDLWSLGSGLPTDRHRAQVFHSVTQLAASVPIWNLYRPLSFDLLPSVIDRILSTCLFR
jgi:hypothetical protein